jgi:hypothetical protein
MCRDFVLQKNHYELGYKIWNLEKSSPFSLQMKL